MAKIKHSVATRKRKKRLLKRTKGYFGDRSKQYQQARRALMTALGIHPAGEILPLTDATAYLPPFWLASDLVCAVSKEA